MSLEAGHRGYRVTKLLGYEVNDGMMPEPLTITELSDIACDLLQLAAHIQQALPGLRDETLRNHYREEMQKVLDRSQRLSELCFYMAEKPDHR